LTGADMVTLLHAYGYLMAAANSLGAEQTLCRAFHSVVCFSRAETLAYANFSFAGETLYRLYRLSLPPSVDDGQQGAPHRHDQFFPALSSCRREVFDDLDQYGMAIDPSLCDYGRKNETEIREVERLTVDDATRLQRLVDAAARDDQQVTAVVEVMGGTPSFLLLSFPPISTRYYTHLPLVSSHPLFSSFARQLFLLDPLFPFPYSLLTSSLIIWERCKHTILFETLLSQMRFGAF